MQNAHHVNTLPDRSVEDEVVLKSSDRHYAHALQILTLKRPGTAQAWQRNKVHTRLFQGWHKTRRCLGIIGPDVCNDLKRILATPAGLREKGRAYWFA